MSTMARPWVVEPLLPPPMAMGIMERIVVRLVIRMGRRRVAPASMSAVLNSMVPRYWLAVSTKRMPLFTTVPIKIRNPRMEVMLMVTPVKPSSPKDPTRLNGIVVITMTENFGDSNWAAMTTNTRNTATAMAL